MGYSVWPDGSEALEDLWRERQRQMDGDGFSAARDDAHDKGELAGAAACYALNACRPGSQDVAAAVSAAMRAIWPWAPYWWKPGDRRHDLVKAGALILAEIERLDRAAAKLAAAG